MSDFDKEAERERLREKYEKEEKQRETTERMSELLLKGATMTNAHCGTCGDPVFRYEGQEFCPTCQEVITEEETAGQSEQAEQGDAEPASEAADTGTDDEPASESETATDETVDTPSDLPERRQRARVPDRDRRPSDAPRRPDPPARRESTGKQTEEARTTDATIPEARESLRRSLVRFAREAERAEDPRRALEHLEAAHEAADALVSVSEIR